MYFKKGLIVEKEPELAEILFDILAESGVMIESTSDYRDASKALYEGQFDFLIADDAFFNRELKFQAQLPPAVIVLSSALDLPYFQLPKGTEARFLRKPFDVQQLLLHLEDMKKQFRSTS